MNLSAALLLLLGTANKLAYASNNDAYPTASLRKRRLGSKGGKSSKSSKGSKSSKSSSKAAKMLKPNNQGQMLQPNQAGLSLADDSSKAKATRLASNLRVMSREEANFDHDADCSMADWSLCYTQTLTLEYTGDEDFRDNQFELYFSAIHRLLKVDHPDFDHMHVIGDLTYIKPNASFSGFTSRSTIELPLVYEFWSVQNTDKMPRWFVAVGDSTAVIDNTDTEDMESFVVPYTSTLKTSGDNNVPIVAESRFALNDEQVDQVTRKLVEEVDASTRIIPTPLRVEVANGAQPFDISGISITGMGLLRNLRVGAYDLMAKLGVEVTADGGYSVALMMAQGSLPSDIAGPESYKMEIKPDGAAITAEGQAGLFHGLMSFLGLLDVAEDKMALKEMTIKDKPRFTHRGHQVDVARNFRSKEAIMKTIDAMALYKLNVLHLAMTNDEGWRLEIPGLEELTSVGSKRCFDPSEQTCLLTQLGSGPDAANGPQFYTRQDYMDILQYAQDRNVQVWPEFNMPAHARAAVISMEARARNTGDTSYRLTDPLDETHLLTIQFYDRTSIINPCLDSSVKFVKKLVSEVKRMHDDADVPLVSYHFGGDEAKNILLGAGFNSVEGIPKEAPFEKSPACQAKSASDPTFDVTKVANYWAITTSKILADNGINELVAWEDGLRGTTKSQYSTQSVAINFWETLFWGGINGLADISTAGFDIIMSNPDYLYFDFPYEVNPEERGYYWAARFNSVHKVFAFAPENLAQNAETSTDRDGNAMEVTTPDVEMPKIRGMQGQTWSETIRTDDQYYEMAFPRTLAVAERAWHRASWEQDWTRGMTYSGTTNNVPKNDLAVDYHGFVTKLGCHEMTKMQKLGIKYRVPPPGGKVNSGVLTANSELPCTAIHWSKDDGETWTEYDGPVNIGCPVLLKSVSPDGSLASRTVTIG